MSKSEEADPGTYMNHQVPERHRVSDWASALSWGRDESELVTELQAGSEAAFSTGMMQLFQVVFAPGASNAIPWTRAE